MDLWVQTDICESINAYMEKSPYNIIDGRLVSSITLELRKIKYIWKKEKNIRPAGVIAIMTYKHTILMVPIQTILG
jgi:hypothetical protein